ncbi:MAG: hypothetical protein U9R79_09265 [Armatimonadota bacterium]|nr:hypothetical protein [Armatimonadota bacterium]
MAADNMANSRTALKESILKLLAADEVTPFDVLVMWEWSSGVGHREIAATLGVEPIEVVRAMERVGRKLDAAGMLPEEVAL